MAFTFLYLCLFIAAVSAANDWSRPCFHGECEYDLPTAEGQPSGTVKIWGPRELINDITPAAGWAIIECDPNKLEQDIRLVCEEGSADHCGRLTSGKATVDENAVGRVVRLPEECGGNAFGVVKNAWVPQNQNIPAKFISRLTRRDGTLPTVQSLSLGVSFAEAASTDPSQQVRFALSGSNFGGAAGNLTRPPFPGETNLEGRGLGDWLDGILDGLKKINEWNVDKEKSLRPVDVSQNFNIFDQSIQCAAITVGVKLDVDTRAHAAAAIGVVATGTFFPPKIDDFAIVSTLNANIDADITLKASVGGELDSGKLPLFEVGVPGLSFPGILTIGPKFQIAAQATAGLELAVDMNVGVHYKVDKASFRFPPKDGHTGTFDLGDTPLSLTATPGASVSGTVAAHVIPRLTFGVSALADIVKADVYLDLDASASMKLNIETTKSLDVAAHQKRSINPAYLYGRDTPLPSAPFQQASDGKRFTGFMGAEGASSPPMPAPTIPPPATDSGVVIVPITITSLPSPSATDSGVVIIPITVTSLPGPSATMPGDGSTPPQVGGCFDIDVGFDVNLGAEGSFFGLFDASTSVNLFTKHWSLVKKCFGSKGGESKRSLAALGALRRRESRLMLPRGVAVKINLKCETANSGVKPQEITKETVKPSSAQPRDLSYASLY